MAEQSGIKINNLHTENNGGEGVKVQNSGKTRLEINNLVSVGNKGDGFQTSENSETTKKSSPKSQQNWYQRPMGMLGVSVTASLIAYAILSMF